jgi:hypothetical protein
MRDQPMVALRGIRVGKYQRHHADTEQLGGSHGSKDGSHRYSCEIAAGPKGQEKTASDSQGCDPLGQSLDRNAYDQGDQAGRCSNPKPSSGRPGVESEGPAEEADENFLEYPPRLVSGWHETSTEIDETIHGSILSLCPGICKRRGGRALI